MFWSNTAKALMLDAMDESIATGMKFGSLHTAYSTTGTNEVTGGSPAYARKGLTWAAASSGSKALAATLPTWDVPASTTVAWVGLWDAVTVGTFLGMMPAGGAAIQSCDALSADITANTINAKAHGYTAGTAVVFWGTLPTDSRSARPAAAPRSTSRAPRHSTSSCKSASPKCSPARAPMPSAAALLICR
jgi:hypothetical protein